jgi:SAM-dependent methyltransferase
MLVEQAERHYRGQAGQRYFEKRAVPSAAVPWVSRLRGEKFSSYVRQDDVVLEYGVGAGWNLATLQCKRKLGFDVTDLLAPSLSQAGIESVADIKSIATSSVDVVICHHTLEHVMQPVQVLGEIQRVLRPTGKLLLFVPHEREKKYKHFKRDEPNHHLYSWNTQTLGNLAEEAGFQVSEAGVKRYGYDRFAAVWADKLHGREKGFRMLRNVLHLLRPLYEIKIVATKRGA